MPTNNINVRLITKPGQAPVLDVEDNGGVGVHKSDQPTDIVWHLVGSELAQAKFADLGGSEPGFQWVDQPPTGIFENLQILPNGNLKIADNHREGNNSVGTWIYKLRVVSGNMIYSTQAQVWAGSTEKNPVIINKDP